jgi:acyl-CoA thioesterase
MSFLDLTRVEPTGQPGSYTVEVPDGWQQGAGAFGGFVLASLVRGLETTVPGRALRSLTAEIAAPVMVGKGEISAVVLRAGQSVTVVAARLTQGPELRAHAVAVLGAPRPVSRDLDHVDLAPPAASRWQDTPLAAPGVRTPPPFTQHFDMRLVDGHPVSGSVARTTGWVKLRDPGPAHDAALVVAHVDAWYPAEFARLPELRPMVTSAFTMQIVGGAGVWTPGTPLLHTSRTLAAHEGYVVEGRELWTAEGKLVALNQQTLVMVK